MLEIVCVPAIAAIVFLLIEVYKKFIAKGREKFLNFIPLISGVLGLVLGIVFFYAFPTIIAATNLLGAILIGLCSGLSATGCSQIFKQLKKYGIEVKATTADAKKSNVVAAN